MSLRSGCLVFAVLVTAFSLVPGASLLIVLVPLRLLVLLLLLLPLLLPLLLSFSSSFFVLLAAMGALLVSVLLSSSFRPK